MVEYEAVRLSDKKKFIPEHISLNGKLKIQYVYDDGAWIPCFNDQKNYEVTGVQR